MNVITNLAERRQKKQLQTERKMLRELPVRKLKDTVYEWFAPLFQKRWIHHTYLEDICSEYAIESFILGALYSRFGYYGESLEKVHARCMTQEQELICNLYDEVCHLQTGNNDFENESLYMACEYFIHFWWKEGFFAGTKRHKLRLQ